MAKKHNNSVKVILKIYGKNFDIIGLKNLPPILHSKKKWYLVSDQLNRYNSFKIFFSGFKNLKQRSLIKLVSFKRVSNWKNYLAMLNTHVKKDLF
jgi:hypothetical protein